MNIKEEDKELNIKILLQNQQRDSLLLYETPVETRTLITQEQFQESYADQILQKKGILPPIEQKPSPEDVLHLILPPRQWNFEGKHYIQYVSSSQSSREDVANLQKLLDERLLNRQARESGLCKIREELHSQCFDEIIRQVSINCPERGYILMRVRDELKMTIAAYQTLYQNSLNFGIKKQLKSELGQKELEIKLQQLENKKINLENYKIELINKKSAIEKRLVEKQIIALDKMKMEIEFQEYQNRHLQEFIKALNPDPKYIAQQ